MAVMSDVAAKAGVSLKTVSRVLNNEAHVRPHLRERVLEAARELNYLPNQAARRMAGRRSFLAAFIYRNPNPPYVAGVQFGAAAYCRKHGYHLVIEPVPYDENETEPILRRLKQTLAPDIVLVTPPLSDDENFVELASRLEMKLIRIAGYSPHLGPNVPIDDRQPALEATRHLLDLGHRRIAFISPPALHLGATDRSDGFRAAMAEADVEIAPDLVRDGEFTFSSGYEAARILLAENRRPTAIFAANDEMALGAMAAARDMGLSLPRDLSVVGFDDIPAASLSWPQLTTVRQPFATYGLAAIALGMDGGLPEGIDLKSRLIKRKSTAPPGNSTRT